MNMQKKMMLIFSIFLSIIITLFNVPQKKLAFIQTANVTEPIRISVLCSNAEIPFWQLLINEMKIVEQENYSEVNFTFYNAKVNEELQENQLSTILLNRKADVIIYNIVDETHTKQVLDKTKLFDLPIIFLNNGDLHAIKTYKKAFFAAPNPINVGTLVGNIVIDSWNKNKDFIDKNHNNVLEYVTLQGTPNSLYSTLTSATSILTINNSDIKTQELANKYCNWDKQLAYVTIKQMFLGFGTKIEAIITVDDGLAIGAIEALQEYGYNLGDKNKKIMVVGVAGQPVALDMIINGYMTGTATLDMYKAAKDLYTIAMNLLNNKVIVDGTDCTIDSSGKIITFPFKGIFVNLDW